MSHSCHAFGCTRSIPPKLLFCAPHWKMTETNTQRLIWLTYRKGQEIDKAPSPAYLCAQALAVADVARREGKWDSGQCADHVINRMGLVIEKLTPPMIRTLSYHPLFSAMFDLLNKPKQEATESEGSEVI